MFVAFCWTDPYFISRKCCYLNNGRHKNSFICAASMHKYHATLSLSFILPNNNIFHTVIKHSFLQKRYKADIYNEVIKLVSRNQQNEMVKRKCLEIQALEGRGLPQRRAQNMALSNNRARNDGLNIFITLILSSFFIFFLYFQIIVTSIDCIWSDANYAWS